LDVVGGAQCKVLAHVDDLLAILTVARRAKHAERVKSLREIQARRDLA